jgi:hypothetical protein
MKTGDDVKVWLPGESPWAIVLAALPDGRLLARLNNELVNSAEHGYRFGDVATFEIDETRDYKIWKLAKEQIRTGPSRVDELTAARDEACEIASGTELRREAAERIRQLREV